MNHEEFISQLKNMVCHSDFHKRYYTKRARKYKTADYWIKRLLGFTAIIGSIMAGINHFRILGSFLAGGCAFLLTTILPNFHWDEIVSGLKDEQEEWTRIFQGYEGLLRMSQILNRDEMLILEYQKVEEMRKNSALNDRNLPEDEKLLRKTEAETREYWREKFGDMVIPPLDNPKI